MASLHGSTPGVAAAIVDAIRRGAPVLEAVRGTGVSTTTFYRWKRRRPEFGAAIAEAEREARSMCASVRRRGRVQLDITNMEKLATLLRKRLSAVQVAELKAFL